MLLSFTLSMPGVNSWDGRWSGEKSLYVVVRNLGRGKSATERAQAILDTGYYSYSFGDGWRAGVSVREVTSSEARKLRKISSGFHGYDWMVDSIIAHREIIASS